MPKHSCKSRLCKAIIPAAFIFVVALLVRIIYMYQAAKSLTFSIPIIDSAVYDYIANRIINDGVMDDRFFWHSFFYPFVLSRIYYFTGSSIIAAKIIQAILGSVTSVLVYVLAKKLFDRKIGVIAGLIYALYGPAVFFETQLLAAGWACFWAVTLILLLLKAQQSHKLSLHLVTGLCAGAAVLTRATFIPFIAAVCIWLIFRWHKVKLEPKTIVANTALLILGIAAALTSVSTLNYIENQRLTPLPEAGPLNLYIGNNPNSNLTRAIRPAHQWKLLIALPKKHGAQNNKQAEEYFIQQVKNYARTQPKDFLKNLAAKTGEFFTSREIPRNIDIYTETKDSSLLSALVFEIGRFGFPLGVLFPLSLIGFWLQRRKLISPVVLFLLLYPLAIILVFPAARYRLPIVPVLAPLAAAGLLGVINFIKERKLLEATALIVLATLTAALTSIAGPYPLEDYDFQAETFYCVGHYYWRHDRLERANHLLSQAVQRQPEYADAHNKLARVLYDQGKYRPAIEHFQRALQLGFDSGWLRLFLAEALLETKDNRQAMEHLQKAQKFAEEMLDIRLLTRVRAILEKLPQDRR